MLTQLGNQPHNFLVSKASSAALPLPQLPKNNFTSEIIRRKIKIPFEHFLKYVERINSTIWFKQPPHKTSWKLENIWKKGRARWTEEANRQTFRPSLSIAKEGKQIWKWERYHKSWDFDNCEAWEALYANWGVKLEERA